MNLFSVIVASYNNGIYLEDLIKSIQKQTYSNWELVIADDNSKDDSRKILEKYKNDKRIKVVYHHENKGASATFKTAFEHSTGEFIGMLGADDALVETAVEEMVDLHEKNPEASLICSTYYQCDNSLNILFPCKDHKCPPDKVGSLILDITVGNFSTFKREAYLKTSGFDESFKKALDHDIYLKLDEVGSVIYYDKPLYYYRINPIGISQHTNWLPAAQFSILAKRNAYLRRLNQNGIVNISKKKFIELMSIWYYRQMLIHSMSDRKICNTYMLGLIRNDYKKIFSVKVIEIFLKFNFYYPFFKQSDR